MKARLFVLATITLLMACSDSRNPSGPTAPDNTSKLLSDGAHGGNPDFFFLPPMVSDPSKDPNFEPGKFNSTLAPTLTVEICELQTAPVDAQGVPVVTDCKAGPPLKKFLPGTVQLQNPPDGFYQVVWNTKETPLDAAKYYRIKVLVAGATTPFGAADVDPVLNMKEFRNARTGEVIPLNDNASLPIKFRIEKGGGPALCGTAVLCTSTTVTNNSPAGSQTVTVDNGTGAIAGARFPNGWLPADGPQNVVVTIAQVDLGSTDPTTGTETNPCHIGLPLQQFPGCFRFTTTPALQPIDESGAQFAERVAAAVCFTLYGTTDPREQFAEMYASGPNEPAHALEDASDVGLLSPDRRNCSVGGDIITALPTNSVTRFATLGWRKVRSGVGQLFGVKTAYAVDAGLGGWLEAFSNVGPAISATIEPVGATHFDVTGTGILQPRVRLVGSNHHDGAHQNSVGLGQLPVTWTVSGSGTTLLPFGTTGTGVTQLVAPTDVQPIDPESPVSGGGYSAVNWTVPATPGNYSVTANGPALSGPVTFTVTVTAPPTARAMVSMQTGATIQLSAENVVGWASSNSANVQVSNTGLATAIVGGENSNGGDGATIGSVLASGAPGPVWLINTPFDIFPRSTNAVWAAVPGAATYDVEIEFGNGCSGYANCGTWTSWNAAAGIDGLNYAFVFVGTQPGRWRVTARDANGTIIPGSRDVTGAPIPNSPSPWIYFKYIDGL